MSYGIILTKNLAVFLFPTPVLAEYLHTSHAKITSLSSTIDLTPEAIASEGSQSRISECCHHSVHGAKTVKTDLDTQ